jgi:hypothetical protein
MKKETELRMDDAISFDVKYNLRHLRKENDTAKNMVYEYYEPRVDEEAEKEPNIFFLFETETHSAFAHWVYESAIFLPYFEKIKSKHEYRNMKILQNRNPHRTYKKLFMNLCQISEADVVFLENAPVFDYDRDVYFNIPRNNICIVCNTTALISMNEKNPEKNNLFLYLIECFKDTIYQKNPDLNNNAEKLVDNLFFPRNKFENYHNRGSWMDYTFVNELLQDKPCVVYDTNKTVDFKDQIKLLASSRNVYLDYGSSFFVNGLFCRNSIIYVTGVMGNQVGLKFAQIFYKLIGENNKIVYLTDEYGRRVI